MKYFIAAKNYKPALENCNNSIELLSLDFKIKIVER